MAIMDPWPPDDPTEPLEFDQRGCCWPWGPDGPREKVQLRYEVIGGRDDGPINDAWLQVKTGQVVIAHAPNVEQTHYQARGLFAGGAQWDTLEITCQIFDNNSWLASGELIADLGLGIKCSANLVLSEGENTLPFSMPVFVATGPDPKPEWILCVPLRWYQSSAYPYLG